MRKKRVELVSAMLEIMMERKEMIRDHQKYIKKIRFSTQKLLDNPKMLIFGSILRGDLVAESDIDILIIAQVPKNHLKRADIIAKIEESAGLPMVHPFHINLITQNEFENWRDIYRFEFCPISSFLGK